MQIGRRREAYTSTKHPAACLPAQVLCAQRTQQHPEPNNPRDTSHSRVGTSGLTGEPSALRRATRMRPKHSWWSGSTHQLRGYSLRCSGSSRGRQPGAKEWRKSGSVAGLLAT